jgi:hypothetical protein
MTSLNVDVAIDAESLKVLAEFIKREDDVESH